MTAVSLTFFPNLRDPHGKRVTTTWPKLVARLSVPRIAAVKHDVPGLSLATYAGDKRALANVESVWAIGLDLDKDVDLSDLHAKFASTEGFIHTTHSSTLDVPRCRVFLLLSRPVTADEYRRVYQATSIMAELGGLTVDRAASDPSRFWFLPSVRAEGCSYVYWPCTGKPINVDAALRAVPAAPSVPPPPPSPRPPPAGGASAVDRARAYLSKCEVSISGSGGHNAAFIVAQKLVRGFALSVDEAHALLANDWNPRCQPPWSDRALRHKVEQAASLGRMPEGDLLERGRR